MSRSLGAGIVGHAWRSALARQGLGVALLSARPQADAPTTCAPTR